MELYQIKNLLHSKKKKQIKDEEAVYRMEENLFQIFIQLIICPEYIKS
jgi:hypothetical protein